MLVEPGGTADLLCLGADRAHAECEDADPQVSKRNGEQWRHSAHRLASRPVTPWSWRSRRGRKLARALRTLCPPRRPESRSSHSSCLTICGPRFGGPPSPAKKPTECRSSSGRPDDDVHGFSGGGFQPGRSSGGNTQRTPRFQAAGSARWMASGLHHGSAGLRNLSRARGLPPRKTRGERRTSTLDAMLTATAGE
jgi:hypothetical protein